jgi:hypothetical protein
MAWYDSVGNMAKSVVDFSGIPGLIHDIANSGSNDDPWYVDGINLVKNTVKVGTTPVRGAVKGLLAVGQASYEAGGKVRREGVDVLLSNPFMYNKYKTQGESYADYTARVDREKENISLGQATLGTISPGKNAGENSGWFADWTDNNFRFLSSGFDLFNAEDREVAFNDQYTGKFISGIQDVVASVVIDPLTFTGFLGKGAVIAARAPMLENINGRTARAVFGKFAMTNDRMDGLLTKALDGKGEAVADIKFLAGSDAKTQYAYWKKKKVTNPDAMAYLFARATTEEEVVDTFRAIMLKDTSALAKRADADPDVALALDAMQDVPHPQRLALEGKLDGDVIISEPYNSALGKHVQSLANEDFRYRAALETASTGGQLKYGFSRGPWEGKLAEKSSKRARETFAEADSAIFQASSLHPIVKVVNHFTKEVPSGVFNVNDGDSYVEFNAFLREANLLSRGNFGAKAAAYADEYLAGVTPGERLNTIKRAERDAMETLFPNYDKQQLDKVYAVFDARRASAIKKHNDQGFVSYMENGQVVAAQSPILQRESANIVVIADLRKLKRGIDAHEATLPGLLDGIQVEDIAMRTERGLAILDTVNDIFKTSVLMRLGYTVRNLTEAQLSMLAKGFALPAMVAAGGSAGVARFFNNRKVGFNRLIDQVNVMSGKVDDLKTLQYEFATGIDQLRAVDMSRQQLAKAVSVRIGEIERDRFKLRLTGDTGPLNVEDELRTLRGVLADLESVTLYHGSPDDVFKLDKTRSLALSASPTIANRYASGGIIKSVEQYIETPKGVRPGRISQKPSPEGGTIPSAKRQEIEAEAMIRLQSDMIDAVNSGASVEIKRGATWQKVKSIDYETLVLTSESDDLETVLFKDWSVRPVFRVNASKGSVTPVRSYGKPLYMTKWGDIPPEIKDAAFGGSQKNYRAWVIGKGWKDADDKATKVMADNGYGRLIVADDKRAGGVSHIVLPGSIGTVGRENNVKSYLAKLDEEKLAEIADDFPAMEQKFATAKERRMARHQTVKRQRIQRNDNAVNPYYTRENVHAMINNGVEDAAENLSRIYAMQHAHLDDMADRISARISAAESNAIKSRLGYGTMNVDANGHSYELPNAFEGASWFLGRTSAEQTWNAMVSSQEMAFTVGIGSRTVSSVKPNDPRYFEAWSNILNMHFRDPESGIMDPLVRQILNGATDTDLLKWFKTFDGSKYANDTYTQVGEGVGFTKLRAGELDEHLAQKITETRGAVKVYIPDEDTALFLSTAKPDGKPMSGAEVQDYLINRFGKNPEELPEINGLLVTTSKEYRDQERLIDTFNRRVMRWLGSLPEDVFARHPLTQATYERRLRLNIDQMAAGKGGDRLTAEELSRAVRGAREEARQEVERTLFTIVRRTGASSSTSMRLMFPFYTAYENTLKRWGGIISENPSVLTSISRTIAQVVNGQLVVDRDGNRIEDATQLSEGGNLVVQVPQGFINSLPNSWKPIVENSFKNINIPLQSLDVITMGQPGNPGAGPFLVLPAYLIIKGRPELEDAFEPLFPVGTPQNAYDLFTPAVIRRLTTLYSQDELYVRTFNQMLRYETYNYNSGKRDEPTLDEITDRTNKFFLLRALTSISAPFAIAPEMDFYQRAFRQFQEQYGPGEAEAKFLEQYPDYFEATVSLSKSPGGLEANVQTVRNLKKYRNLMAAAEASDNPELIGFLANDFDGQYTFSQAAYQWQYRQGAYPGSKNTYRQNRNPAELVRDANVKRGWTEFGRMMDGIDAFKIQNGITSERDPRLANHLEAKRLWVQATAEVNFDWYSEYISPDRAKYERRARVLERALQDKNWMQANGERPVVKSLALYLDIRKKIGAVLEQRKRLGGAGSLDAKSNADVADVFNVIKTQLVAESPEFGEFFNRYFLNDSVVV